MAAPYLALVKAEYDYAATTDEELSITEDQVLYVLEYTDDDWWKVRVKVSPTEGLSPEEAPTGLVPSTYVVPLQPIKQATALYDYEATSEEEISIKEDVVYHLFEEDGDWTLVGARDKKEVGYAPTAYLEVSDDAPATNGHTEAASVPAPPPAPPLPTAAASTTNSASTPSKTNGATSDKVLTWSGVTELEGKKKKKGTLGIGNGALFFASDSDKAPVQKKDLSILKDITTEKGKQIKLYFTNGELLLFTVPKDDMEAITSKLDSSREFAQNRGASQDVEDEDDEEDTYVPPPPPLPPTSGGGARAFGFLPPPPRRMVSTDTEPSDDDEEPPQRSGAGGGSAAIPAAPPPPPAPPLAIPQAPRAPAAPVAPPAPPATEGATGGGKRAKAGYDFTASEPEELSLAEGETLYVLDDNAEDWWKVRNERGEEGEVPASYVELLEDTPAGATAGANGAAGDDADEEAARRLHEEERAEARREKERLRLKKLEEEARGLGSFDFQPPPARKSTASSAAADTAAAARAVAATRSPSPPPPPAPPAPPAVMSPPPASAQAAPSRQDSRDQHDALREQRRERHRQRELQREKEKAAQAQAASPVEKTKPSPSRVRTWVDRTGAFKVDAEFVGLSGAKNEKIRLHKLNGVVIEVPLDKMSQEDIRLVEHMVRKKLASSSSASGGGAGEGRHRSDRHRGERSREGEQPAQSQQHRARPPSAATANRRSSAAPGPGKKDQTDWFEWFLNAGCDIDDCERYARNFEKDRIDVDIVGDLEASTLRSLGLREGDVIRVRKYIAKKTGGGGSAPASAVGAGPSRGPPPPDKDAATDREQQLHEDEELARKLQEEMNAGRDGSGLFTNASGGVKNTRRGRPQPKSAPSAASFDSIASSLTGIDRTATPGSERVVSPDTTRESSRRSRADSTPASSGFDDDAWTVKPSPSNAKAPSPVLIDTGSSASSARATPSPAPVSANAGRDLAPIRTQTASPAAMPTSSKEPSSAQALTDAYLDSIGLGKRAVSEYGSGQPARQTASPAPPAQQQQQQQQPPQQQQPQQTGYAPQDQMSPQQTGYYQQQQQITGPRPPPAPIPLNQQLLNPLIPTQTGMTGFIPTRNQQSPMSMMPQHTNFQQPMQQPMQQSMQQPMQTGFPGQSPFGNQFAVQQQPMMQQPQYGGMMQAQATGYPLSQQMSHLSMQPTGMPYQAASSPQPQPPMHIPQAPPPPPMPMQQQQPQQTSSSSASDFQPASVFAKMKAGQFAQPDSSAQPQQKYDALRPQPTSFGPMQPQPTGFGQMQPLQAQPTGFAPGGYISMPQQQPNMMYPQQTGYPYRPY